MILIAQTGAPLKGSYRPAGDKSLSHRAALFAALAEGESVIERFLVSGVTHAMLRSLTALGIVWELSPDQTLRVAGQGLCGFTPPAAPLDCGNSATTLRLLAGAVAGAGTPCVLDGSEGLRRRPMGRIADPLSAMGAQIELAANGGAPIQMKGGSLKGITYAQPVASAQVKSCLMLAALSTDSPSTFTEPGPSRDHTERMLAAMGAKIETAPGRITVYPQTAPLKPLRTALAGDISSAAFLMVAAAIVPGSEVRLEKVGLNPTRTGIIDALRMMGASITVENEMEMAGEPIGDLVIRGSRLTGTALGGDLIVRMIDEFPAFAIAAACAEGETRVNNAEELRHKESDRIAVMCGELHKLGVKVREFPDGFAIEGGPVRGGSVAAHGDHRLAMSLALAGLVSGEPVAVHGAEVMNESFPDFAACLRALGANFETLEE